MNFRQFLNNCVKNGEPIFFDGGMGTMLQNSAAANYSIPEEVNFTHPYIVREIHTKYLQAGADIVTANSFGATPVKLKDFKFSASHTVQTAVSLAKEAVNAFSVQTKSGIKAPKFAALDIGPTGCLLEPTGTLSFEDAYSSFATVAIAGEQAGADLAIIETMSDLYETKAAILAVKETTKLPILATVTFQPNLRTLSGASVITCVTYLESLGVDAIGLNCGVSLENAETLVKEFCKFATVPVIVQPNAGLPVLENGKTVFKVSPEDFAKAQLKNWKNGAAILGGCCGTTPAHIEALSKLVKANKERESLKINKSATRVCSATKTVTIGGEYGPVIIGERINPTGKKKCKEALLNGDMEYVINEAESQINAGAHILDVNVGLPGIDEKMMMYDAIYTLQKTFTTPLQIDSSEKSVLELAMRRYNGKPLVNSVNGKQKVMDEVFPLIKKYGGTVVALTLDESGIPETAEGRIEIAKKIIKEAEKYNIKKSDIIIDFLTLTCGTQQKEAKETLRGISLLKKDPEFLDVKTVLGVSNISFGLPRRDIINSYFFSMALNSGLDACIINPLSQGMMDAYKAFRAIYAYDENCLDYIKTYTNTVAPTALTSATTQNQATTQAAPATTATAAAKDENTTAPSLLYQLIIKGYENQAEKAAEDLLKTTKPVDIVEKHIVPALDVVGKEYESGKKFLPQLLLSANTVSKAFSVIKKHLAETGETQETKGKIIMATVEGDIHDIGKNIVCAMLENYGYQVLDLGKDVKAETIIETAEKENITVIGLSALMTTTVLSMETTIQKLRAAETQDKKYKIIVGGAVLTKDYAAKIGANYYGKDAMATVNAVKQIFGK